MASAVRRISTVTPTDVIFSLDGTKIFASQGGSISVYSAATGALITSYDTGRTLGGLDITPDGTTLLAASTQSSVVSQSAGTAVISVRMFEIDLGTGAITSNETQLVTSASFGGGFYDVAALSNTTAVLTRIDASLGPAVPLTLVNLATGAFTQSTSSITQTAILSVSPGHGGVLVATTDQINQSLGLINASGTITATASTSGSQFADGVQAYSATANRVVVLRNGTYDGGIFVYDGALNYIGDIRATIEAQLGRGTLSAIAFSTDGTRLYGVNPTTGLVYEFATSDWHVTRTWASGTAVSTVSNGFASGFGNEIAVSPDGHYLTVSGRDFQLIDLTVDGTVQGTSGNDTLAGTSAIEAIYGYGGNDILTADGADTLIGGAGDDTYVINAVYPAPYILELANGGNDTVITSVTFTAPLEIENVVLADGAVATITANDSGMRLTGNALGTQLNGGSGNDTLIGGRGDDYLYGNGGDDVVVINDTLANSTITVLPPPTKFYSPPFSIVVNSIDGNDSLNGVERIQFSDGTIYTANAYQIDNTIFQLTHRHASATDLANISATLQSAVSETQVRSAVVAALHLNADQNDFNGDGRSDVLWRNSDGSLSDWLGTASGGFIVNDSNAFSSVPTSWKVVETGDFNGDGRADILWRNADGALSDWLGIASGGFTINDGNALINVGTEWKVAGAGDFNGDGRSDILWRNDNGALTDWLGTASGGFIPNNGNALTQVPASWHVAGVGDFNGDGRSDILWRSDSGALSDWLGTASGGFTNNDANAFTQVTLNWHVVGTGDFNGDGNTDILWRSDDGKVSDWLGTASGGFTNNDNAALSQVPTSWTVVATDDYNGDGRADILWRNDSGAFSNWLGNSSGGFTINDASAYTTVSTSWQVQPHQVAIV